MKTITLCLLFPLLTFSQTIIRAKDYVNFPNKNFEQLSNDNVLKLCSKFPNDFYWESEFSILCIDKDLKFLTDSLGKEFEIFVKQTSLIYDIYSTTFNVNNLLVKGFVVVSKKDRESNHLNSIRVFLHDQNYSGYYPFLVSEYFSGELMEISSTATFQNKELTIKKITSKANDNIVKGGVTSEEERVITKYTKEASTFRLTSTTVAIKRSYF